MLDKLVEGSIIEPVPKKKDEQSSPKNPSPEFEGTMFPHGMPTV